MSRQKKIKQAVLTRNIEGLSTRKSKHKEKMVHEFAKEFSAQMIGLTESHLSEEVEDREIVTNDHQIFSKH